MKNSQYTGPKTRPVLVSPQPTPNAKRQTPSFYFSLLFLNTGPQKPAALQLSANGWSKPWDSRLWLDARRLMAPPSCGTAALSKDMVGGDDR